MPINAKAVIEQCARRAAEQIGRVNYVASTAEFQEIIRDKFDWIEELIEALEHAKIRIESLGEYPHAPCGCRYCIVVAALDNLPSAE
jgi:hypothetical protein